MDLHEAWTWVVDHRADILSVGGVLVGAAGLYVALVVGRGSVRQAERSAGASERSAVASEESAAAARAVQKLEAARDHAARKPRFDIELTMLGTQENILAIHLDYIEGPDLESVTGQLQTPQGSRELFQFKYMGSSYGSTLTWSYPKIGDTMDWVVTPPERFGGRARLVLLCEAAGDDPSWTVEHIFDMDQITAVYYRDMMGIS